MAKTVRDAMTANPRTIGTNATVVDAARLMKEEDTGIAPIVDGNQLVGVLTDRDIAIKDVAESKDPLTTKAVDIASTNLVTVDPDQDLDEAMRLMGQHQVRRLPVVEDDGKLVGVLAQADVAREGKDKKTGELVEEISK
jgi:CBS domain-containing protein